MNRATVRRGARHDGETARRGTGNTNRYG